MQPFTCTDCGKPTGSQSPDRPKRDWRDYLRCRQCQAAFNDLLHCGGRPAEKDEMEPRIACLQALAEAGAPLFTGDERE
jgi:DNA-directed RNA polymerase subunit RPC12/RpoP